ncbi:hypothetical protein KEH51_11280 [[Brevibacterium] frigoritolerans]|uniref:Uncharacterized protein n=1 Tax=Peribacillus frigoritolerans TaxID=450367 RepID=A0A941J6P1_9BACI|nr:hypothetical protein [Peribacillus frigoritolerans]
MKKEFVSFEAIDIRHLPTLPRIDYHTYPLPKTDVDNWWAKNYSQPPLLSINVDKANAGKMVANGLSNEDYAIMILNDLENIHRYKIRKSRNRSFVRPECFIISNLWS